MKNFRGPDRGEGSPTTWIPSSQFEGVNELCEEIQKETGRGVIATFYYRHHIGMPDDLLLDDYSRVDRGVLIRTYLRVLAFKEAAAVEQPPVEPEMPELPLADVISIDRNRTAG